MNTQDDSPGKRLNEGETCSDQREAAAQTGQGSVAATGGQTDEPPIIIGNGSLSIDLPRTKEIVPDTPASSPRPVRYKQKEGGNPIRAIGRIQALRLKAADRRPVEWFAPPEIAEELNSQLHIWLEQLNEAGNAFMAVHADLTVPQIIIKGPPFSIEVDKELIGPQTSFKSRAPFRYRHPGYTGRHFRISRWLLVGTAQGVPSILHEQRGDDDYILHVSFWHD